MVGFRVKSLMAGLAVVIASSAAAETVLIEGVGPTGDVILVEDGEIAFAGPPADIPADMPPIGGARIVDAGGAFAAPGLTDMHVHVWSEAELAAYLAHGVTTVRNLSGMPFHLRMAQAIEAGDLEGPRLLTSGPILNSPGPNAQINHQIVLTEAEGRDAVRAQHAAGYDRIKVYSNLTAEAWRGIHAEAEAQGMAITGHSPEGPRLEGIPHDRPFVIPHAEIVAAGFETLEHVETIYFHGLRDRWDPAAARRLASEIAAAGVPVTPTLVAQRNLVRVAQSEGAYAQRPGTEWLNPVTQSLEAEAIAFWAGQDPASELERAGHYSEFTAMLRDAGVVLVAGSDAGIFTNTPGAALLDELELLVEAGLTPAQALASATTNAALALGESGRLGCLAAGCRADIVFLACDPAAQIACLRQPRALMRAGRWYDAAALEDLRRRAGQHDGERIVGDLLEGMAAQGTPLDPAMLGM